MSTKLLFWGAYVAFAAVALYTHRGEDLLALGGPLAGVKLLVWASFVGFLAYSVHCSMRENLFRSIGKMAQLHWGRQVGADLYLGLALALLIVYLHEGLAAVLWWLIPTVLFANLSILLYFAIHFDSLVARFLI